MNGHPYTLGRIEGGDWIAVSTRSPYFCFQASSRTEVEEIVKRALSWYFGNESVIADHPVPFRRPASVSSFRAVEKVCA